jgi:hypothetical protein
MFRAVRLNHHASCKQSFGIVCWNGEEGLHGGEDLGTESLEIAHSHICEFDRATINWCLASWKLFLLGTKKKFLLPFIQVVLIMNKNKCVVNTRVPYFIAVQTSIFSNKMTRDREVTDIVVER